MKRIALPASMIAASLALAAGEARADPPPPAPYTQIYKNSDGTVLLKIDPEGRIVEKNSQVPWEQIRSADGGLYSHCYYVALDESKPPGPDQVIRKEHVWYLRDDPESGNTDASNRWVYWQNVGTGVYWGRCPTRRNPNYEGWKREKGPDLWQVVPKGDRPALKGVNSLARIGKSIDPRVIGPEDPGMPLVAPVAGDEPASPNGPIFCVDLDNVTFN